jgi:hypothetical protein
MPYLLNGDLGSNPVKISHGSGEFADALRKHLYAIIQAPPSIFIEPVPQRPSGASMGAGTRFSVAVFVVPALPYPA